MSKCGICQRQAGQRRAVGQTGQRIGLVRQYSDFPLGAVDASAVAIAERLGIVDVATLDHRHFRAIRPNHVAALNLLPG